MSILVCASYEDTEVSRTGYCLVIVRVKYFFTTRCSGRPHESSSDSKKGWGRVLTLAKKLDDLTRLCADKCAACNRRDSHRSTRLTKDMDA